MCVNSPGFMYLTKNSKTSLWAWGFELSLHNIAELTLSLDKYRDEPQPHGHLFSLICCNKNAILNMGSGLFKESKCHSRRPLSVTSS